MEKIEIKSFLNISFLFLAFVLAFSSCTKEEETVIIPKTLDTYKLEFGQFVASEKAIVSACVIGYNKGNFKVASTSNFTKYTGAYMTQLNAAEVVVNKTDVTIADIVAANKALNTTTNSVVTPGKTFYLNVFISDRRPLVDPIIAAETLNAATLVGTASGQVTQAAKTTYTAAITVAKTTRDLATTIDRQVTEGVTILAAATTAFKAAIIK